MSMTDSP